MVIKNFTSIKSPAYLSPTISYLFSIIANHYIYQIQFLNLYIGNKQRKSTKPYSVS